MAIRSHLRGTVKTETTKISNQDRRCGRSSALDDPSCCRPKAGLVVGRTPHCVYPLFRRGKRSGNLCDSGARWSRAQNRVAAPGTRVGGRPELVSRRTTLAVSERQAQGPRSIFLVSIESLEKRKLTSPPLGSAGDCAPAISPDGRRWPSTGSAPRVVSTSSRLTAESLRV